MSSTYVEPQRSHKEVEYVSKGDSQTIFDKLNKEPANRICFDCGQNNPVWTSSGFGIHVCLDCSSNHRNLGTHISMTRSKTLDMYKRHELRRMKLGGNEAAIKWFKANGGTATLNNKDTKIKYSSEVATNYKRFLDKLEATDAVKFPDGAVITDDKGNGSTDGTTTPAGEPEDNFWSSFDKPSIKRPTPPISRTATPPVIGRTPSPFLNTGNGSSSAAGIARTSSPLVNSEGTTTAPTPASRTTSSAALRKTTAIGSGPRKANVLGAKKTKLGAKKLTGDVIDFDAAEKKAKEEAERIAKLGYDPDAEVADTKPTATKAAELPSIASPTPISPSRGSTQGRERTNSEMERLGMGMGRLGFGQVGGNKPAAGPKKMGGFGSVGPSKAAQDADEEKYARQKFGTQKGISSDEFFSKGDFDPNAKTEAKQRLQGFEGATAISSNAYFGRPEEEAGGEEYGDLESAAKDFVRKFGVTAGDDLENLTQVLGEGATRLQGAIRSYLNG